MYIFCAQAQRLSSELRRFLRRAGAGGENGGELLRFTLCDFMLRVSTRLLYCFICGFTAGFYKTLRLLQGLMVTLVTLNPKPVGFHGISDQSLGLRSRGVEGWSDARLSFGFARVTEAQAKIQEGVVELSFFKVVWFFLGIQEYSFGFINISVLHVPRNPIRLSKAPLVGKCREPGI